MKDQFSEFHPLVNFLFFGLVLLFTMCFMHPICLMVSLATSMAYAIYLNGKKAVRFTLLFLLPMMLLATGVNIAFNHQGNTILTYFPNGNPLTLESMVYGVAAAVLLICVITWFSCYTAVMSSDKFIYLFGRIIPALSLVLSMTLRFIPKFKDQMNRVVEAQKCLGQERTGDGVVARIQHQITILSIMLTWSLENAIETADSMKCRGYGLEGRTAFSIYTLDQRDKWMLLWLGFCGCYIGSGWLTGALDMRFYPTLLGATVTPFTLSFQLVYLMLCITPLILNQREDSKWKNLLSQS